ncbi:hypothetical protein L544_3890 [Bordetella hinzii OH87 BAL007II]|uniref:Uncharacterized protein n=1 Tax=Bordetella hinzii OH87 BAL007II TaxID=1331262 RepID=A0ABR4QWY8_9BORD|nr:hypothetical protein L544_3890 [Bordetella hinzii OH87 BAL007II]
MNFIDGQFRHKYTAGSMDRRRCGPRPAPAARVFGRNVFM